MEISNDKYVTLVDMVSHYNTKKNTELEAKFKNYPISLEQFKGIVRYYKSIGYNEQIHEDSLDVFVLGAEQVRLSIVGKTAISHFCKNNKIPDDTKKASAIISKKSVLPPLNLPDVKLKIDLKTEAPVDVDQHWFDNLTNQNKAFRLKKRMSYTDPSETVRVDLTIVKSSPQNEMQQFIGFKRLSECMVVMSANKFEIEIEVIKRNKTKNQKTDEGIIQSLLRHAVEIYSLLEGEDHVVPQQEKENARKGYLSLCFGKSFFDPKKPKQFFAGPQPITLEQKNIVAEELGIVTIQKDYTVTEKADGERMLLYVSSSGKCFLIDSRLHFKYTGAHLHECKSTLLDGEYITKDVNNQSIKVLAIFDIYKLNGKDISTYPLIGREPASTRSRLQAMESFVSKYKNSFAAQGIDLQSKQFRYNGKTLFDDCKNILDTGFKYNIDGLIFTPKYLPVGGSYDEDKPSLTGTWNKVFKWKPSKDNSIDFLVRFQYPNFTSFNGQNYQVLDLRVGYNPQAWKVITARSFLEGSVNRASTYIPEKFIPGDVNDETFAQSYFKVDDVQSKLLCGDSEISDNCIVEFKYVDSEPLYPLKWKPMRVRTDKTEMFRKFGLPGTANDYGTAMNIWRSIRFPVTEEMIRGNDIVLSKDLVQDDIYYYRNTSRDNFASRPMLDFHNYWIKHQTIFSQFKGEKNTLFDVSCGKGGDLPKWLDNNFAKVLGIDISRDNIENPVDGIYARLLGNKSQKYNPAQHTYVFVCLDSSQKLTEDYFKTLIDSDKEVCMNLWGMSKPIQAMAKYHNFANDTFDVVSCQFSIHYFFESEAKLDNLIWNINKHLKQGGVFIGTCLDGMNVKKLLKDIKKNESVIGTKSSRTIWSIEKKYTKNKDVNFGEKIEVYMESIGRKSEEYLVNFDILVEKLAALDIVLVEKESFDKSYAKFSKGDRSADPQHFVDSINSMTSDEKKYSFLNIWFKFQKKVAIPVTNAPKQKKKLVLKNNI
jgi:SAM-dependent methyltransferase